MGAKPFQMPNRLRHSQLRVHPCGRGVQPYGLPGSQGNGGRLVLFRFCTTVNWYGTSVDMKFFDPTLVVSPSTTSLIVVMIIRSPNYGSQAGCCSVADPVQGSSTVGRVRRRFNQSPQGCRKLGAYGPCAVHDT